MGRRAFALILGWMIATGSVNAADSSGTYRSNMAVLETAIDRAVLDLLTSLPGSLERVGLIVAGRGSTLVRSAIAESLLVRGVSFTGSSGTFGIPTIEVRVRDFGIAVRQTGRAWLVGPRMIHREAVVLLSATVSTDSVVSWSGDSKGESGDWIPVSAAPLAKGPAKYGLDPVLPGDPLTKVIEPAIVTGTIAAILYLFFTK